MLLLHTCCAPCAAPIIEWLLIQGIRPALFFFNPNIHPQLEYEIRKNEVINYANFLKLQFFVGDYHHSLWLQNVKGLESQLERGNRCLECFKMRLLATAYLANEQGFSHITTTLSSSRWKDLKQIFEAGNTAVSNYSGIRFLDKNWRKNGLSERKNFLLKKNRFYNQTYCGCEFSLNLDP